MPVPSEMQINCNYNDEQVPKKINVISSADTHINISAVIAPAADQPHYSHHPQLLRS